MIHMIEQVIIRSEEVTVVEIVGLSLRSVFTAAEDVTVSVAGGSTLVVMCDTYIDDMIVQFTIQYICISIFCIIMCYIAS